MAEMIHSDVTNRWHQWKHNENLCCDSTTRWLPSNEYMNYFRQHS